jgi:hypothetical protein
VFEIGSTLREARERRGVALAEAEEVTRIRARYLAALEDERFAELPGQAYARSFLREYGEFLGLEGDRLATEYDLRFTRPQPTYVEPVSVRARGWPWRGTLIAFLVAAGILVVVLALVVPSGGKPKPKAAPSTHHHPAPPPVQKPTPPPAKPSHTAVPHLQLVAARGSCWLEIHGGSQHGPLLYEGTLAQGGSLAFARRFLWIRVGAPSALDVRLNGRPLRFSAGSAPVDLQFALRGLKSVA